MQEGSIRLYRRLLRFAWPYWPRAVVSILCGLASAGMAGALFYVLNNLLQKTFEAQERTLDQILGPALLVPLVILAEGALAVTNGYMINWVGHRVVLDVRNRLFRHLQNLSLDFHNRADVGQLIARVMNDAQVIEKSVSSAVVDMTKEPFVFVACAVTMFVLDWKLSLIAFVAVPICFVPISILARRIRRASRRIQAKLAELVTVLHEALTGIRVVKAFQAEETESRRFYEVSRKVFTQRMRMTRRLLMINPVVMIVASCGITALVIYAYLVGMSAAHLIVFIVAANKMYDPVKKLSRVWTSIQEAMPPAERIFEILDRAPTIVEADDAQPLAPLQRAIQFEEVSFGYDGKTVLDRVSLEVPVGQFVAIVGPSGAGKTTLVHLLARFYDPTAGAVRLDGQDLRRVKLNSLLGQIGIVSQETILFHDSIANNIKYGKPSATQEEIETAARRAHAHDFIAAKPEGYETIVGEKGIQLSGGQRQRIAIARALLKNPPILILDEATSALDTEQERAVQAALDELMRGRTVFAIAHRLSTVQHANRILVLDRGRIVESGTHADLLARGGLYKKLFDLQFNA